ncbi:MAG: hypothetical protein GDA43_21340 [Hormoscilla sp. SP5CHS1]|nr:hypothetical protein [Hormoscilla sp. SP5CHS1]
MKNTTINLQAFDLSKLEQEYIHLYDYIQPHGVMLSLAEPQLKILQASNNTSSLFDVYPQEMLQKPLRKFISKSQMAKITKVIKNNDFDCFKSINLRFKKADKYLLINGILHRNNDNVLILELEPAYSQNDINGQVMSVELTVKEEDENYEYRVELKDIQGKLVEYMSTAENFIDRLVKHQPNLLDLVSARGAVVWWGADCTTVGEIPEAADLKGLIASLEQQIDEKVFYTDKLPRIYPAAEKYTACSLFN